MENDQEIGDTNCSFDAKNTGHGHMQQPNWLRKNPKGIGNWKRYWRNGLVKGQKKFTKSQQAWKLPKEFGTGQKRQTNFANSEGVAAMPNDLENAET